MKRFDSAMKLAFPTLSRLDDQRRAHLKGGSFTHHVVDPITPEAALTFLAVYSRIADKFDHVRTCATFFV